MREKVKLRNSVKVKCAKFLPFINFVSSESMRCVTVFVQSWSWSASWLLQGAGTRSPCLTCPSSSCCCCCSPARIRNIFGMVSRYSQPWCNSDIFCDMVRYFPRRRRHPGWPRCGWLLRAGERCSHLSRNRWPSVQLRRLYTAPTLVAASNTGIYFLFDYLHIIFMFP